MIKRLRIKMTATVMIFVTVLIVALIAVIVVIPQQRSAGEAHSYMTKRMEDISRPDDTGNERVMQNGKNGRFGDFSGEIPDDLPEIDPDNPPENLPDDLRFRERDMNISFAKANFVTITVDEENNIEWNSDREELYDDDYINAAAETLLKKTSGFGRYDGNYYLVNKTDEKTTILLLENNLAFDSQRKTMIITLVSGFCAWCLFLILMIIAVRKMTEPVKTAIDKQRRFISDAGHELKTPVAVIKANAEVLRSEAGDSKWLGNIGSESDRMNRLISNLMMLAEIDDPTENSVHVRFDLSGTVEGTALPFESLAFENGVELITDVEPDIYITGNASRIEELVSVFINNAIKYGEKEIRVSLKREHKNARLTVYNKGTGIKPEDRDRIFERFYRVDKDRSRKSGNYGLGLAIARSIAEEHGASITVGGEYGKDVSFSAVFKCVE